MYEITPEKLANQVLNEIKDKYGKLEFPIDPFKLLKESGVYVTLREFDKLDGIIINDQDNYTVVGINLKMQLQRQRFTAAHEYCHFIKDLRKNNGEVDVIQCLKNSSSKIEKYADDFAGYLLLPTKELLEMCNKYKNEKGFVDFESITIIAEYFGVSFAFCLNRIAYGLNLIDGDISPENLKKCRQEYKPSLKRQQLIKDKIDSKLLSNMIDSLSFVMNELNSYTGQKFIQNYIYYDNKLEGLNIERNKLNYILADLNYHKEDSKFFNTCDENIIMTLGNLKLQEYVNNTNDLISIKKCKMLHLLLYKYVPFPDDNGKYRTETAVLKQGTIQPINYLEISNEIEKLDIELQKFVAEIDKYSVSEYIKKSAYFVYRFVVIHPFRDGNGRISRAILNWLLRLKNIPSIYIDDSCKEEYYNSLTQIDKFQNFTPFVMLIEKRIINTLMQIHSYLFNDEIEELEKITN